MDNPLKTNGIALDSMQSVMLYYMTAVLWFHFNMNIS